MLQCNEEVVVSMVHLAAVYNMFINKEGFCCNDTMNKLMLKVLSLSIPNDITGYKDLIPV